MSTYRYAVKVRPVGRHVWRWDCLCGAWQASSSVRDARKRVIRWAHAHAASCEALHRANWAAYCPECDRWGRVAPACPLCLGEGWIPTTDDARKGLS